MAHRWLYKYRRILIELINNKINQKKKKKEKKKLFGWNSFQYSLLLINPSDFVASSISSLETIYGYRGEEIAYYLSSAW